MRFACWINNATDTHLENVITIVFSLKKCFLRTHFNIMLYVHGETFSYLAKTLLVDENRQDVVTAMLKLVSSLYVLYFVYM